MWSRVFRSLARIAGAWRAPWLAQNGPKSSLWCVLNFTYSSVLIQNWQKNMFFEISWYFSVVLVIWSSPASTLSFFIFEKNKIRVSMTLFWSEIVDKTIVFHQKSNSFVGGFSTNSSKKYFLNVFKNCLLWEHFFLI